MRRLLPLLSREEPELVREAVTCLERHGSAEQLEAVIPLVSHAEWSVRAEAIRVLGARGVRRSVPVILARIDAEQDAFVRDVMLEALGRLGA